MRADGFPVQLSLGVSLKDDATFDNFFVADSNVQVLAALKQFTTVHATDNIMIWGSRGVGLTHLLQSCCHEAHSTGRYVQYLPLRELLGYAPDDVCDGLEAAELVCLDSIDHICGNRAWEVALFHLFNRLKDNRHQLLIASHTSPPALPMMLPDLKSRVLGSVVYQVHHLNDEEKSRALQLRAAARGMELTDEVARYILTRASRNMNELFEVLNCLDDVSLQMQRKLTIPFVKQVLKY